jgi:hypothetical protein
MERGTSDADFEAPVSRLGAAGLAELRELLAEIERTPTYMLPPPEGSSYPAYAPVVNAFISWVYRRGLVVSFTWSSWSEGRELRPEDMAGRPVADAVRMLTAVVRNDRFCEGALAGSMQTGLVQACLLRILAHHGQQGR